MSQERRNKLLEEIRAAQKGYNDILDAHKDGAELSAEDRKKLDDLHTEAMAKKADLEAEEADEQKQRDMADLQRKLTEPKYRVDRNVNSDGDTSDGRKALTSAGWELKGGMWYAPTSVGEKVLMYSDEVIFGKPEVKTDDEREFVRVTRVSFQPEYRKAYSTWLHNMARYKNEAIALNQMSGADQKALSEGIDTAGGALVPPDMQAEILVRLPQFAVMRRFAQVVPTSRDQLEYMQVLPHPTASLASIYSSGFVGGWSSETPAFSETDPGFGRFPIAIKKLRVATKLSNDFISDAVVDILSWLARNGSENMGLTEDAGFITGDGGPLQPMGLLNTPGVATVDVEGSTANTISNTTAATGSAPKLISLAYALPSQYAQDAQWLMRRGIEGKIRLLVDAQGRFHWPAMNGPAGSFSQVQKTLVDGSPVNNSEWMPDDGVDANKVLVYGRLMEYIIAQRQQITTTVLRERFADTDQTGIILWERVGGALWNTDAVRFGIV